MDTRGTRRELVASVRLFVGAERRLLAGLLGGGAGYLIWLAGTGVAAEQLAAVLVGPVSVDPWTTEAAGFTAVLALLWVVGPSLLAVRLVVGAVTNLRGNVEQRYRFDRPLVLVAPPLAALAVVLGVALVRRTVDPAVLVALGVVNVVLLVRTVAYGYRVYSLSTPRLLQGLVLVAALAVTAGVASRTASLAGQEALLEAAARRYGVADLAFRRLRYAGVSVPVLPLASAAAPGAVALTYVWFQLLASLVVRVRRPDAPRSAVRAGQRYPQVVQPGTSDRLAMGTAGEDGTDGDADEASEPDEGGDGDEDQFSHTRVYTPPEDGFDDPAADDAVKSELCPICGATYEADAGHTNCPNCNAVLETDSE